MKPDDPCGQYGDRELTEKQSPQIASDSDDRNCKEYASDPQGKTDGIDKKGGTGFPETVDDTKQSAVCIEKRADPSKCYDKLSRCFAVEKYLTDERAGEEKKEAAKKPENKTDHSYFSDQRQQLFFCFGSLNFGDGWH